MLRRNIHQLVIHVFTLLLIGTIVAACGTTAQPEPAQPQAQEAQEEAAQPATEEPTEEAATVEEAPTEAMAEEEPASAGFSGTVVVGDKEEPKGLIWPIFYQYHTNSLINSMFYAPLALNENDELIPELLAEIPSVSNGTISEDGKTITLKFKDGYTWHDGEPVTSADFKFTWEFIMNPDTKAQTSAGWNQIDSIDTPDELTAVVHMQNPYAPFVSNNLVFPILPKHALEGVPDPGNSEYARNPIGNGPFMFQEWVSGDRITVVANPNAPDPPKLEKIIFKFVPDVNTLIALQRTGEIDVGYDLPADQIPVLEGLEGVKVVANPGVAIERVYFNLRNPEDLSQPHPIFSDINVRKAIAMGLDRFTLVDKILEGYGKVAVTELDNTNWFNKNLEPIPYDPEMAKQLLDEAGWVVGDDGIREKDGQRMSFNYSLTSGVPLQDNMEVFFQQNLADIGVEMIIDNYPAATLYGSCADDGIFGRSKFDMMGFTNFPPGTDLSAEWSDFYLTSSVKDCDTNPTGTNSWGFSDPAVDAALECAVTELDTDKRLDCIFEAQQLIYDSYVTIYLFDILNVYTISDRVKGVNPTVFGGHSYNYEDWSVAE